MRLTRASIAVSLVTLTLLVSASCARRPLAGPAGGPDAKFTLTAFKQEGSLLAFVVDTKVMRLREGRDYVPVEIAVANKGLKALTLTAESFTLIDSTGTRYPTVGFEELSNGYGNVDVDRRLSNLRTSIAGAFLSYTPVRSTLTRSFDNPHEKTLHLSRFTYAVDFIYFPRPADGVKGRQFDLLLEAPELDDPILVTFKVGGKPDDAP
ncbi:MAG: hypothetical protein OEV00_01305 [Acidobacteriota bacterium]|nr:hypothetical protein [Acidobacteriota bacterium]MDH3783943.1 hypothetical protein [Acidobacteriota bacterium]